LNQIDKKMDLFEHRTKIWTYLKKVSENWDQKIYNLKVLI